MISTDDSSLPQRYSTWMYLMYPQLGSHPWPETLDLSLPKPGISQQNQQRIKSNKKSRRIRSWFQQNYPIPQLSNSSPTVSIPAPPGDWGRSRYPSYGRRGVTGVTQESLRFGFTTVLGYGYFKVMIRWCLITYHIFYPLFEPSCFGHVFFWMVAGILSKSMFMLCKWHIETWKTWC